MKRIQQASSIVPGTLEQGRINAANEYPSFAKIRQLSAQNLGFWAKQTWIVDKTACFNKKLAAGGQNFNALHVEW